MLSHLDSPWETQRSTFSAKKNFWFFQDWMKRWWWRKIFYTRQSTDEAIYSDHPQGRLIPWTKNSRSDGWQEEEKILTRRTHVFRIKYPLPLKRSMQNSREALSRIDLLTLKLHWMNISTDFKRMNAFFLFLTKTWNGGRWRYQMPSRTKCQKLQ